MLVERAADSLHDSAARLLVHQLGVDDAAAIVHAPHLEELHEAGVGVHFEGAALGAVREDESVVLDAVVAGGGEAPPGGGGGVVCAGKTEGRGARGGGGPLSSPPPPPFPRRRGSGRR